MRRRHPLHALRRSQALLTLRRSPRSDAPEITGWVIEYGPSSPIISACEPRVRHFYFARVVKRGVRHQHGRTGASPRAGAPATPESPLAPEMVHKRFRVAGGVLVAAEYRPFMEPAAV